MESATSSAGPRTVPPVVTISASYGAGGSLIAPMLATRLDLPFLDRVLSADVSDTAGQAAGQGTLGGPMACRSGEGLSGAEQAASPGSRLFAYLARGASVGTVTAPPMDVDTDDDLRYRAEAGLAGIQASGGVVLGRAGAVILAKRAATFHVRLDGASRRRDLAAMRIEGIPAERVAERRARTDRARELWVKRLYRADVTDPKWYHLWIDTTVISHTDTVDLIEMAFRRFLDAGHPG